MRVRHQGAVPFEEGAFALVNSERPIYQALKVGARDITSEEDQIVTSVNELISFINNIHRQKLNFFHDEIISLGHAKEQLANVKNSEVADKPQIFTVMRKAVQEFMRARDKAIEVYKNYGLSLNERIARVEKLKTENPSPIQDFARFAHLMGDELYLVYQLTEGLIAAIKNANGKINQSRNEMDRLLNDLLRARDEIKACMRRHLEVHEAATQSAAVEPDKTKFLESATGGWAIPDEGKVASINNDIILALTPNLSNTNNVYVDTSLTAASLPSPIDGEKSKGTLYTLFKQAIQESPSQTQAQNYFTYASWMMSTLSYYAVPIKDAALRMLGMDSDASSAKNLIANYKEKIADAVARHEANLQQQAAEVSEQVAPAKPAYQTLEELIEKDKLKKPEAARLEVEEDEIQDEGKGLEPEERDPAQSFVLLSNSVAASVAPVPLDAPLEQKRRRVHFSPQAELNLAGERVKFNFDVHTENRESRPWRAGNMPPVTRKCFAKKVALECSPVINELYAKIFGEYISLRQKRRKASSFSRFFFDAYRENEIRIKKAKVDALLTLRERIQQTIYENKDAGFTQAVSDLMNNVDVMSGYHSRTAKVLNGIGQALNIRNDDDLSLILEASLGSMSSR